MTTNTQTLAIVLGVVLPLVTALVVFIYLHRKHVKKTRLEDINDKHGSLDFGLGPSRRAKQTNRFGKTKQPEMATTITTENMIRGRGMSMDMGSPYVMSEEIARSRPSLHSQREAEDPYGPVKMMRERSRSPMPPSRTPTESSDKNPLLHNVQSPSRTSPPSSSTTNTRSSSPVQSPGLNVPQPGSSVSRKPIGAAAPIQPQGQLAPPPPPPPAKNDQSNAAKSNFSLPKNVDRSSLSASTTDPTIISRQSPTPPLPERGDSHAPRTAPIDTKVESDPLKDYAYFSEGLGISHNQGPSPGISREPTPGNEDQANGLAVPSFNDPRRLSASMRPLPPDHPEDNPEQRANRIRSFYREYFDDSKPDDTQGNYGDYYEDYGQEYLNDATVWDEQTGQFVMAGPAPYGEPVTRRAMTPPPRGPPRFRPGQEGHRYTSSSGHSHGGRMRAFSTASGGRPNPQGARGRPVKRLPPPQALSTLATPHLVGNDPSTFSTIDFAPPQSMRDRVAGRSQSPRVEAQPYSPSVRAHTPLVPSFNDLAPMPSPHAMRRSGTFTALDFAPPPRFRNNDGTSDAGSIRSGRSGHSNISAIGQHNVRKGAYRISKLPQDTVGTKDDLASALKPSWDMNR